jgi:hypothetical protein
MNLEVIGRIQYIPEGLKSHNRPVIIISHYSLVHRFSLDKGRVAGRDIMPVPVWWLTFFFWAFPFYHL